MLRRLAIIGLVLAAFSALVTSCFPGQPPEAEDGTSGRILVWHSWNEAEEIVLAQILERFTEIHRGATVKIQGFDTTEEMLSEFETAADSGLGADLMFAPGGAVRALAEAELIRSIDKELTDEEALNFLRGALQLMEVDGSLYGMPASLSTTVLYYNQNLTDTPPATLAGLLDEAAAGRFVAMSSGFRDTFWGIQAFGGDLFDDEGRLVLDRGGFVNWLAWLKTARDLPGVLLGSDLAALQERFLEGDTTYYIGDSGELQILQEQLGEDVLGVAPLPSGPIGLAGPLLDVEGLLFSSASSPRQAALAIELAKFITNPEQSALLMRELQHIPANLNLHINPSLMPTMNTLSVQARNSIPAVSAGDADSIVGTIAESYDRVLEGLLDPAQSVADVTLAVNSELGLDEDALFESTCESIGVLRVANLLPPDQANVVSERLDAYGDECRNVVIRDFNMDLEELNAMLEGSTNVRGYADLIIAPQTILSSLVDGGHIRKVAGLLTDDELQRFQPRALDAMRYSREIDNSELNGDEIYGDEIYGFPLYVDVNALYINRDLAPDPALNLVDIETQAGAGVPIVLEANLANGFWGYGSMGGTATEGDSLTAENAEALIAWLNWLRDMRDSGAIALVDDHQLARLAFLNGESAYYVGTASEYKSLLQSSEGIEQLETGLLPSGDGGDASPILLTQGLMVNSATSDGRARLIGDLVRFLTDQETAEYIAVTANVVPANATVDLSQIPGLTAFAQQALAATVLLNTPEQNELVASIDDLFVDVLNNDVPPEEAVATLFSRLSAERGDDLDPADESIASDTLDEAGGVTEEEAGTKADSALDAEVDTKPEQKPNVASRR